ncbi:MFS transporter [Amycolatopsis roodepoortensis]|uniref:MFS transporter n=1 Tax=Amycolatopsis roodepoortensis TaxID=700274 RepID=UPI00214C96F9|nr:MFS transporter [Amycolatopsis roodepoortensis]UUV29023.1 MFS transporter [Amycolatopsis roodepoortensis]
MTAAPLAEEGVTPSKAGIFSREYRASTIGFACVMFLEGFAALALVTTLPVAVGQLDGLHVYALALGGFVTMSLFGSVLAGEIADKRGPRLLLILGLGLFLAGLLVAGTATTMWQLIAGRCVQGFASSVVVVGLNVTIAQSYPSKLRPKALSLMSTCWIVPSMIGPAIAGTVTELLSWRWVFFGLAILVSVASLIPLGFLRRLSPVADDERATPPGLVRAAAIVAVAAGILHFGASGLDLTHLAFAAVGVVALVISVPRLLPEGTLRAARGIPAAILLRGLSAGIYFTLESYIPLMLINQRQISVTVAGVSFTGATLLWAGAAWLQGHPWAEVPRHRLVLLGSVVIAGSSVIAIFGVFGFVPPLTASAALIVAGFGMGLVMPSLTVLAFDHCPPEDQGRYSAAMQVSQGLGSVVLIGAAGALFNVGTAVEYPGALVYGVVFGFVTLVAVPACLLALRSRVT